MTREQRIVAAGALSGVLAMGAALAASAVWLAGLPEGASAGERLAHAARWNALAALPLFLAIVVVSNRRFLGEAIDPTLGREDRTMLIDGRVIDNSFQQYVLFCAANFALAATAGAAEMSLVTGAALIFVGMRTAFWIGYRLDPLYRAFGMAGTSYLNLSLFAFAAWFAWR